jgi:hypothetical protein
MNTKKMLIAFFMSLVLASCAHEAPEYLEETGIHPGEISVILNNHKPQFKSCFQSELDTSKKPKDLQGKVNLKFSVNDKGRVAKSEIQSDDIKEGLALRCMKIILDDIQFPIPLKGKTYDVSQPINFYSYKI